MSSPPPGTVRLLLRPSMFLLHVPAVLAVTAAVLLGLWQFDSWQERREDRSAALADAEPVPLAEVMGPDDPYPASAIGQPVTVGGSWVPDSTTYIQAKPLEGQQGYWVVTLLSTCGAGAAADPGCAEPAAIPVVLGWSVEPTAATPTGDVEAVGWLQPGEGAGDPDPNPADDVLPSLRIASLLQRAEQDLYGASLILDEPANLRAGLEPVTSEAVPEAETFTALRNLLYGLEWWLFAGFGVFLWWRWTRDEVRRARGDEPGTDEVISVSTDADEDREDRDDRDAPLPSRP